MLGLLALLSNILFFSGFVRNENRFPHPLPREEEERLVQKYRSGDRSARDELINHNMRLVVHVAKKYSSGADVEELVSIGAIGLIKAVENYTPGRGTHLATFAAKCIENEILMALRKTKKFKADKSLYEPVGFDKDGNEVALIELLAQDEESVLGIVENNILREKSGHRREQYIARKIDRIDQKGAVRQRTRHHRHALRSRRRKTLHPK